MNKVNGDNCTRCAVLQTTVDSVWWVNITMRYTVLNCTIISKAGK